MKNTRINIRKAHQHGARYYATVESIKLGAATVRLKTNGARLTNLPVAGRNISEGDLVIVDYGGTRPVVKPVKVLDTEAIIDVPPGDSLEIAPNWEGTDHGVAAYSTADKTVPFNTWTTVTYNATAWDTDYFWTPATPERLTAPVDGYYLVLFNWGWLSTGRNELETWGAWYKQGDHWYIDRTDFKEHYNNDVKIVHSAHGEIYRASDEKPFYDVQDTKDSLITSVSLLSGEYIYAEVRTRNSFSESRTLIGDSAGKYPRLTLQFRWYL